MAKATSETSASTETVITSNDEVVGVVATEVEYVDTTLGDGTQVRTYIGVDPHITGKISSN